MAMDFVGPYQIGQLDKDETVSTVTNSAELAASVNSGIAQGVGEAAAHTNQEISLDRARLNVIEPEVENHDIRIEAIETLAGLEPGSLSDATMADIAANAQSLFSRQMDQGFGTALSARDGNKYAFIAGVIRNDGAGSNYWQVLPESTTHRPVNIDTVVTDSGKIRINYPSLGANMTISFLALPDETLAQAGFMMGCSVTPSRADIKMTRIVPPVADYVYYNGTSWVSQDNQFKNMWFNAGKLHLEHKKIASDMTYAVGITPRGGSYEYDVSPDASPTGTEFLEISIRDHAGAYVTTPNTGMKFYLTHGSAKSVDIDPTTVDTTAYPLGNIWLFGVMGMPADISNGPPIESASLDALVGDLVDTPTSDTGIAVKAVADASAQAYAAGAGQVTSVAGRTGAVTLAKADVGLSNVDNTSDANKPVSTAAQTALDLKAPKANPTFTGTVAGVTKSHVGLGNVDNTSDASKPVSTATQTALDGKASTAVATGATNGLMPAADKAKLDAANTGGLPSTLALRDAAGQMQVTTPTAATHVARKDYVDGLIKTRNTNGKPATDAPSTYIDGVTYGSAATDGTWAAVAGTALTIKAGTARMFQLISDKTTGRIWTRAEGNTDAWGSMLELASTAPATASVDGLMPKADKSKLDAATGGATGSTLALRYADGRLGVTTPTGTGDATNKSYVDGRANFRTTDGKQYQPVSGVIRNDGFGAGGNVDNPGGGVYWKTLGSSTNHRSINIDKIVSYDNKIRVMHQNMGSVMAVTFIAQPDETLAQQGIICGTSVTPGYTDIKISQVSKCVSDYVYYDGANWVSQDGIFTGISFSAGTLTLNHESIPLAAQYNVNVTPRSGSYVYTMGGGTSPTGSTFLKLETRDNAGALVTTANANMKFYVSHGGGTRTINPLQLDTTLYPLSNIWLYGVMAMD